jgi:hypothetical protein
VLVLWFGRAIGCSRALLCVTCVVKQDRARFAHLMASARLGKRGSSSGLPHSSALARDSPSFFCITTKIRVKLGSAGVQFKRSENQGSL